MKTIVALLLALNASLALALDVQPYSAKTLAELQQAGKPVARLCPLAEPKKQRVLGRLRGKIVVPDDFDTMFEEEIRAMFEDGC